MKVHIDHQTLEKIPKHILRHSNHRDFLNVIANRSMRTSTRLEANTTKAASQEEGRTQLKLQEIEHFSLMRGYSGLALCSYVFGKFDVGCSPISNFQSIGNLIGGK